MACARTAKNTKVKWIWNSLCGVLRHNPYVIQINFGAKFARTKLLPLRAQVGNSLFLPMPPRLLKSAILTPESFIECRTGIFSCCVISWFLLSVKSEFRNYSSWHGDPPKVLRDPWRTRVINRYRDFTTVFYVILRPKFSEWFELCEVYMK